MIGLLLAAVAARASENETQTSQSDALVADLRSGMKMSEVVDDALVDFDGALELINLIDTVPFPSISCYTDVLFSVSTDCATTTDDELRTLALRLTKCYFNITGRLDQYPYEAPEEDQTGEMSAQVYAIYTTMKLHWRNICMFMKQIVFTEEASKSLVELLHGMIKETMSLRKLQRQLQEMSERLNKSVSEVRTQFGKVSRELDVLLSVAGFDTTFIAIFEYIDLAISIVEQAKFYLAIGVTVSVISLFLPGLMAPMLFVTAVSVAIDRILGRFSGWNGSIFRASFKLTYLIVCCAFPVIRIVRRLQKLL